MTTTWAVEDLMSQAFEAAEGAKWKRRRGFPNRLLFSGFPDHRLVRWSTAEFDPASLVHIRNEPGWKRIAGESRRPAVTNAWVDDNPEDATARAILSMVKPQVGKLVPPIVVRPFPHTDWVILEGNKRVAAAFRAGRKITCITGEYSGIDRWHYYRDRGWFANWRNDLRDRPYLRRMRRSAAKP